MKYKFWHSVIFLSICLALIALLCWLLKPQELISPLPKGFLPVKYVVAQEIGDDPTWYIKHIFGEDANKALRVAYCESRMRPNAIGDDGKAFGLFQINVRWHKIPAKYLLNYKINTLIAYQLFKENHDSFKLWSCNYD